MTRFVLVFGLVALGIVIAVLLVKVQEERRVARREAQIDRLREYVLKHQGGTEGKKP